ncbi:hypothetical protein THASP1DRAFT_28483 [Thamnocephalis sphaerospora]|uniref:Mediator of RNA polymerase II transcription subunit 19 n=1 Tax=Thamnocephalis sphaerospora TaxID=78915 RepID=A0A4P9XU34_9FUNG|nr:hypothetical protein THASP1DRAFT_28483 [Thamnocephalis sphaerospora]|eukprot:RKP09713.1 hypothetical protein THASP1DRAFT_28483 [Thamnocephalis sphaerospora]
MAANPANESAILMESPPVPAANQVPGATDELFFVGTLQHKASALPLGNVNLLERCGLAPFYQRVVAGGNTLPDGFDAYVSDIPGRALPSAGPGLIDLIMRPAQNEGVEMQPFDEDQLARALRLQPGILVGYDASLLDQDDDGDEDNATEAGRHGSEGALDGDREHRRGSGSDRKHKKKKKKRKHDREGETEEERRKRKKRKRERAEGRLGAGDESPS